MFSKDVGTGGSSYSLLPLGNRQIIRLHTRLFIFLDSAACRGTLLGVCGNIGLSSYTHRFARLLTCSDTSAQQCDYYESAIT